MAPGFDSDVLTQVQQAVDIADVVGETVALKRRGRKLWGLCPFHSEKTPSFSVDPERQLFFCFGCKAGGNVFGFVMQRDGRTFPEAVRFLADRAGVLLTTQHYEASRRGQLLTILQHAQEYFRARLAHPHEGRLGREFLDSRGVDAMWADRFGLGYAPDRWDGLLLALEAKGFSSHDMVQAGLVVERPQGGYYDRMRGRLTFPIWDPDGRIVGFGGRVLGEGEPKYLNSPETEVYQKGRLLYGAHLARAEWRTTPPILVEGYFDVIACHRAGLSGAVASLGTSLTHDHAQYLARFSDRVIVCYDRDDAGVKAAERAFVTLAAVGLSVLQMEIRAGKDVDEFLKTAGPEAVRIARQHAEPYLAWRIRQEAAGVRVDPEAKARGLRRLRPLLNAVRDPVERQGLAQLLQRSWSIEPKILSQALREKQDIDGHNSENFRHNMGRQQAKIGLPADEVNLLSLLIQFPDQLAGVLAILPELCRDPAWAAIVEHWSRVQDEPLAEWMHRLPKEAQSLVAEASAMQVPSTPGAVTTLAARMRQNLEVERWNALQVRAALGPLDAALAEEIRHLWPKIQEAKQSTGREG